MVFRSSIPHVKYSQNMYLSKIQDRLSILITRSISKTSMNKTSCHLTPPKIFYLSVIFAPT